MKPKHGRRKKHNKKLLLACGAKLNDDGTDAGGGVYLVDVDTREEAQALIDADPFHKDGDLFERVTITRWRKAYLDGQCYI
ncbi:YciI family protein [Candidimonas sp. SYP-B2681]|uniref:YciI family protein n=1 Tax=Candidimonas sp. SYP-B2681 TaxID=2497686 RepID=UPI003511B775